MEHICIHCGRPLLQCATANTLYIQKSDTTNLVGDEDYSISPYLCEGCGLVQWYADDIEELLNNLSGSIKANDETTPDAY